MTSQAVVVSAGLSARSGLEGALSHGMRGAILTPCCLCAADPTHPDSSSRNRLEIYKSESVLNGGARTAKEPVMKEHLRELL